jgi:hypothetical protein
MTATEPQSCAGWSDAFHLLYKPAPLLCIGRRLLPVPGLYIEMACYVM